MSCAWNNPQVDEEGFLEGIWSVLKPCELNGVKIYSDESEIIKIFGEPKDKLLVSDLLKKQTISTLIYDSLIFHVYKQRVIAIYLGELSILEASVMHEYPIDVVKKYSNSSN